MYLFPSIVSTNISVTCSLWGKLHQSGGDGSEDEGLTMGKERQLETHWLQKLQVWHHLSDHISSFSKIVTFFVLFIIIHY